MKKKTKKTYMKTKLWKVRLRRCNKHQYECAIDIDSLIDGLTGGDRDGVEYVELLDDNFIIEYNEVEEIGV